MNTSTLSVGYKKIALVAHDKRKLDLLDWAKFNRPVLAEHQLFATGTTGALLEREAGLDVVKLKSGPWGGDQQIGAKIADGEIDFLIFFWDPLETLAHDSDIKALLRISVVWNIPVACNRASADFMISSLLMTEPYERIIPSYDQYVEDRRGIGHDERGASAERSRLAGTGTARLAVREGR